MPPRAASRLTVTVIPGPGAAAAPEAVLAELGEAPLVAGGEGARRAGTWPRERFFANGQGGFRVACPATGAPVADRFWRALEAWRRGGPRTLACACGAEHDLDTLAYAPPAGFAAAWIEAIDAASDEPSAPAAALLARVWPGYRVIGSRG